MDILLSLRFANHFSDVNEWIVVACPLFTMAVFGALILQVNLVFKCTMYAKLRVKFFQLFLSFVVDKIWKYCGQCVNHGSNDWVYVPVLFVVSFRRRDHRTIRGNWQRGLST